MNEQINKPYQFGKFALYDSTTMPYKEHQHLSHFAITDAFITYAGETKQPIIHFWQTSPLVILGMMDTKVGHFKKALEVIKDYEHDYIIRNSGGLGVISDPGVLNISLIYPTSEERLSIDQAYEMMLRFVQDALYPLFPGKKIEAYEITNSYCFGDYDLSIDRKKIAGISQRRIQNGIAVMIYISVSGDQKCRAQIMKDFYKEGLDGSEPSGRYPHILPEVMTTLEEAYGTAITIEEVKVWLLKQLDWFQGNYNESIDNYFKEGLEKMYRRNERFLGEYFLEKKEN